MKEGTLGHWPMFMMLTLSVGLSSHVIVLPAVLDVSMRDAWMCGLLAFVVIVPWLAIFVYGPIKRTKQANLREWLRSRLSPAGAWLVVAPVLLFLLVTSFQSYVETTAWTSATFLPLTPEIVVQTVMMMLIASAALCGLRSIAFVSCMLLPVVVILGDFVMSANMPHKNYSVLLPMLEHGWGAPMHGMLYALSCAMEIFLVIFLQHYLKHPIKLWQIVTFSGFIMILMTGPTIGAITEFGPIEAEKLRYPAFSQWRLVSIGKYFEHVDFFAIFQWMSGAFIRVSLGLNLMMELIPVRGRKGRAWFVGILGVIYIVLANVLAKMMIQAEHVIRLVFIVDLVLIVLVTTTIWLLSFHGLPKGRSSDGSQQRQTGAGDDVHASNNL
ncbi:GerAB/ArcD/ProY family transporter [Paenibacillus sacheonensis]|uniref:GerAB/ArcD/ProY family transporter n=1 Tax=Paenibacillus sacheonensis TaxID=742054 RepID=A0A7X5BWR5_9BACL|nr:GerAB/ArcD/ProY family transporter [Paenibacillus sacheonensis]MBM7563849.1 spore germination protein (amino acid permease) [Paenibacillus sacheonensis]NBC67802.1 GerAB/ArcD/ProY family transporter [Paenibacillus sacheonensis]